MDEQTLILKTQIELSTQRVKVIKAFENADVLRPKEIAALNGMNINNVSKILNQLKKIDLVTGVSSKGRARYYSLTDKGKYIIDYVDDCNE
ncbi:winged helix DNA-binding protein [uncultured Methanobrevibacter sp.]|uniref:winged helix DNA-binding protein n=1 Tax=uncultured Methanobrevibacter sp. TaxID=253161 RepID=UPI0025E4DE89|nr:winged helix DNA-binding protein [uncultured Methanobrevibacter sp.]